MREKKGERESRRPMESVLFSSNRCSLSSPWPSPLARPTPSPRPPWPPRRRQGRAPGGPGRTRAGARRGPRLSRSFDFESEKEEEEIDENDDDGKKENSRRLPLPSSASGGAVCGVREGGGDGARRDTGVLRFAERERAEPQKKEQGKNERESLAMG